MYEGLLYPVTLLSLSAHSPLSQFDMHSLAETLVQFLAGVTAGFSDADLKSANQHWDLMYFKGPILFSEM